MSSLVESAKAMASVTLKTDKANDLQRDTQLPQPDGKLTTDHGVKVTDTDNWCVAFELVSVC